ncbi:MAG: acyl-CoA thioesterase [Candidatus Nanohaloarchaea archaeon]|nr:acyl-CoA thioesterase [Candidatus Nanohaloarchaea archaeon]
MASKRPVGREEQRRMRPRHANTNGDVFGGEILRYMDDVGSATAEQYAGEDVVTASINRMSFDEPVDTDDLLILDSQVDYVGDTSITVSVDVYAEEVQTGNRRQTASAYLTYVAEDGNGSVQVPDLDLQTQEEQERYREAVKAKKEAVTHAQGSGLPEPDAWDVESVRRMRPRHAGSNDRILGGEILGVMDETASIAAERYAGEDVVTVSLDTMSFEEPVFTDDLLKMNASVDYVGTSSMVIAVDVQAEDAQTGTERQTGSAYLTFVALDDSGNPVEIDDLHPQTQVEQKRYQEAEQWRDRVLDDLDG